MRYIAVNHDLPPPQDVSIDENEMHQPPLYYVLAALGISWIDVSDNLKSRFLWGVATAVRPDPLLNDPAQSGTALANRVARLVSALLSTVAVWCTYLTLLRIAPGRTGMALLATALHGLWPMFVFMGGVISNDIGVGLAGSLVFLFGTRLLFPSPKSNGQRVRWSDAIGFGLSITAAVLMKDTGAALVVFGGAVAAFLMARLLLRHQYGDARRVVACVAGTVVLLAGAYVVSDGRTSRQLSGTASFASGLAERVTGASGGSINDADAGSTPQAILNLNTAFQWLSHTLFGVFGRGSNSLPDPWYAIATLSGIVGVTGLGIAWVRRQHRLAILYALFFVGCVLAAPFVRVVTSGDAGLMNGRFVLAAYGAIACLFALGLWTMPRFVRKGFGALVVGGFGLVSLAAPLVVVGPTYARAPLYAGPVQGFAAPNPTMVTFGDAIQLIGYDLPNPRTFRTGTMDILLFWRALRPLDHRFVLRLEAFSASGTSLGSLVESEPALGSFPTTKWKTTDVYREGYFLQVYEHVKVPVIGAFRATWLDADTHEPLAVTCADLKPCNPLLGAIPIGLPVNDVKSWSNRTACYKLGNLIDMVDASVPASVASGETLTVTVVWRSRAAPLPPLTTYVHLFDQDGKLAAQTDSPARSGEYPTEVWAAGEVVPDAYSLTPEKTLAPGTYAVMLGMYDSKTHIRLPVVDNAGQPLKDDEILLGDCAITAP